MSKCRRLPQDRVREVARSQAHRRAAKLERAADGREPGRQDVALMARWRVAIIGGKKQRFEKLGTVEAPNQHEAYRLAIEKFNVPIEHQSRLFVIKSDEEA